MGLHPIVPEQLVERQIAKPEPDLRAVLDQVEAQLAFAQLRQRARQLHFGLAPNRDVLKQDGKLAGARIADAVGVNVEPASHRLGALLEAGRLAGQRDFSIQLNPVRLEPGHQFQGALARSGRQSGL